MRKSLLILFLIVAFGLILRFSYLTHTPPSPNWDEVSHGYNAYSILKTGKDQWGKFLPIFNFRAYGDYPLPLNLYLTIPFIALGLSEFSIRFPHALVGVLTIISTYFLCYGLTKRKDVSLLAAFLIAIEPWTLFTSRFVLQVNLSIFLLTTSFALFFNRQKKKYFLPLALILLFLTLFSYHTTRIFSPLILFAEVWIYRKEFKNKLLIILTFLFFATSFLILRNPEARTRSGVLFLVDQGAVNRIIESRNSSKLPVPIKRIVYNRPVYFIAQFTKNYVSYFSPQFLFLQGGTQYQFSVPNHGLSFLINLPFFYIGLVFLIFRSLKSKDHRLILCWLLLSSIPASLTNESFAVIRATTMLPVPDILVALGFFELLKIITAKRVTLLKLEINFRWLLPIFILTLFFSMEGYLVKYFTEYRENYSWSWQYGYKEVVTYAKENYGKYDKIIVTKKYGEPHEFFLFFWPWDPAKYQNDPNAIRFNQSNWWWVDRFDKFYFLNDWQVKDMKLESGGSIDCTNQKCLLITSPENHPSGWHKLETIDFLDNKPAFEIYENTRGL